MKKEGQPYNQLPDGSWDFGNGVISPSLSDRNHFNSVRKSRGKARLTLPVTTAVLGAISLACSRGANKNTVENTRELEKESSGYALPFPEGETWFLTSGPHADGFSNGVRYAIDIAPPEGGFCPPDGRRLAIDSRLVTASASGEVILKGDDKNRKDPHHSEVRIKDRRGLTQVYIHLDNTKVQLGSKVSQGQPLGNPSCEYPPGGANTGPHVHVGLMKDGQAIAIDGTVIGGWTIHNGAYPKDGTMTKPGERTRTADPGRFADKSDPFRNDLPNKNGKGQAVVAFSKDPIPPISGQVTEKKIEAPTPTPTPTAVPTPKPTETPKPVEKKISISKKPEDMYHTLASAPLSKYLPSGMSVIGNPNAVSSSEIANNLGKMFGATPQPFSGGSIFIDIDDERSNPVKGKGYSNVSLQIAIFTNNQNAQDTYNKIVIQNEQTRLITNFPYPAVIQGPINGMYSGTAHIENVLVGFTIRGNDMKIVEQRTMDLTKAMPKLLQEAGN